jgi:Asp-tRNA(Asn)/Glu-tRNA(Gln) amidotransferase A subunit family amidase
MRSESAVIDALLRPTATRRAHVALPNAPLPERVLRGWAILGNATPFNFTEHPSISIPAAAAGALP